VNKNLTTSNSSEKDRIEVEKEREENPNIDKDTYKDCRIIEDKVIAGIVFYQSWPKMNINIR
jgi:hypothetical protein